MEKHQKVCVGAFLFNKGKVLIMKRSKKEKFMPGYWDIPGGKMEFGETPEEALKREAKEEINLGIEAVVPCSAFSYVSLEGSRHNVDIQYIVRATEDVQKIKIMDAHEEYRWIDANDLENLSNISDEMRGALGKGFELYNKLKLEL